MKWRASIKVNGKSWYLGLFRQEKQAAEAYDGAAWFVWGEYASATVNFPSVNYDLVNPPREPPAWLVKHLCEQVFSVEHL